MSVWGCPLCGSVWPDAAVTCACGHDHAALVELEAAEARWQKRGRILAATWVGSLALPMFGLGMLGAWLGVSCFFVGIGAVIVRRRASRQLAEARRPRQLPGARIL